MHIIVEDATSLEDGAIEMTSVMKLQNPHHTTDNVNGISRAKAFSPNLWGSV